MQSKGSKIVVALLAVFQFAGALHFQAETSLTAYITSALKIPINDYTRLESISLVIAFISGLILPFFLRIVPKFFLFILADFIYCLSLLLTYFCDTFLDLFFIRIFSNFAMGIEGPLFILFISDLIKTEDRGKAISFLFSASTLASIIGTPIGIYVSNQLNWNVYFCGIGFLCLITLLLVIYYRELFVVSSIDREDINPFKYWKSIFSNKILLIALIQFGLATSVVPIISPYISVYLLKNLNLSSENLTIFFTVGSIASILCTPISGRIVDKYGSTYTYFIFSIFALAALYLLSNSLRNNIFIISSISAILYVSLNSRAVSLRTFIMNLTPKNIRASFTGINSSTQLLIQSLAIYLTQSFVITKTNGSIDNFSQIGYISIALLITSLLLFYFIRKYNEDNLPIDTLHSQV